MARRKQGTPESTEYARLAMSGRYAPLRGQRERRDGARLQLPNGAEAKGRRARGIVRTRRCLGGVGVGAAGDRFRQPVRGGSPAWCRQPPDAPRLAGSRWLASVGSSRLVPPEARATCAEAPVRGSTPPHHPAAAAEVVAGSAPCPPPGLPNARARAGERASRRIRARGSSTRRRTGRPP